MSLGRIFTAPVEKIVSGGSGLVHHNGQTVFVDGTAAGDIITGRIFQEKKGWAKAELLTIEKASSCRTEALCPLYGRCGGCNFQHINYQSQLEIKADIVKQAFLKIGKISGLPEIVIHSSDPFEYRNRIQFHRVKNFKQGKASVGFKMRESGLIIPAEDCPVADPGIRHALQTHSLKPHISKDRFTVYARNGIFLSESDGALQQTVLDFNGKKILMDVNVFFQSNGKVLEKLLEDIIHVIKELPRKKLLGDFYCGVGTFSIFLQDYFEEIDLLEENKEAVKLAQKNLANSAQTNGAKQKAEYYALSDTEWVSAMKKKTRSYDAVIADPPRPGLSPAMRTWLCEKGPPLLLYVSCDPASLARDSDDLIRKGSYMLKDLRIYDFYPQTAHIESLGVFVKDEALSGDISQGDVSA